MSTYDGDGMPDNVGGPGLAAVRERVAATGGVLHVRTAQGEGTTVIASLPATQVGA